MQLGTEDQEGLEEIRSEIQKVPRSEFFEIKIHQNGKSCHGGVNTLQFTPTKTRISHHCFVFSE